MNLDFFMDERASEPPHPHVILCKKLLAQSWAYLSLKALESYFIIVIGAKMLRISSHNQHWRVAC